MSAPSKSTRLHVYAPAGLKTKPAVFGAQVQYIVRGQTPHFNVSYDSTLGDTGIQAADYILETCEADFQVLQNQFSGSIPPGVPFHIRLTTDNTGASHATCAATELFIGANSGAGLNLPFMRQLVIAEEDEVFMGAFGRGWDCGASNGEGLSRVLANDLTPGAEPANFVSAAVWLDDHGSKRPDWVNHTESTDTNYVSIGCAVLFLNWMRFQLGHGWREIIAAGAPTLGQTYTNLTGQAGGFDKFKALLQAHFPPGHASGVRTDNPFPLT